MSYYQHHVFFCCNQRDGGRPCCNDEGATQLRDYCKKQQVGKAGLAGIGRVRINQAGCLDRCEEGPVMVIYPEAVWYRYADERDIDEIIERHLRQGQLVERLKI